MQKNNRINTLDSFRFLAIAMVVLFHYYSGWATPAHSLYPYGMKYDFFRHGDLGVQFFFIISGFVISYTLTITDSITEFWKKRFMRLFPPMLICTLVTLLFCIFFDSNNLFPNSHEVINFFCSLTFISPSLLDSILHRSSSLHYTSLSYWSLWPEIQFYFIASLLYYYKPDKFVQNFSITAILLYFLFLFYGNIQGLTILHVTKTAFPVPAIEFIVNEFNISFYGLWFLIGVLFFKLYFREGDKYTIITLFIAAALLLKYSSYDLTIRSIYLLLFVVFWIFVYFPGLLRWLNYPFITNIGLASYTLYLIHQEIGLILINKYAASWGRFDFLLPLLIITVFVLLSVASYRFVEKPINKFLKKI
ncbi:MAG TPA: acyltransferase [Ferruginibacter sp.]|nr:acyltransferase [Ferruginibacter sp.]